VKSMKDNSKTIWFLELDYFMVKMVI